MMIRLAFLFAALFTLFGASAGVGTASATPPPPSIEQDVIARFYGQIPNAQWTVLWTVWHSDPDASVYTRGGGAYSNAAGRVVSNMAMDELASGYSNAWGGDAPIYEVQACLYPAFAAFGVPLACTDEEFIGHVPEPLWNYAPLAVS